MIFISAAAAAAIRRCEERGELEKESFNKQVKIFIFRIFKFRRFSELVLRTLESFSKKLFGEIMKIIVDTLE